MIHYNPPEVAEFLGKLTLHAKIKKKFRAVPGIYEP